MKPMSLIRAVDLWIIVWPIPIWTYIRNVQAASIGEYMAFPLRFFLLFTVCISWNSAHYVHKQQANKKPLHSSISRFRLNRICMLMRTAKAKIKQKHQIRNRSSKATGCHAKEKDSSNTRSTNKRNKTKITKKMVLVWFAFNECFFFVL